MVKDLKDCLQDRGYKIKEILKVTPSKNNIVAKVTKDRKTYVAKIMVFNKTEDKKERDNMKTEIQALKYINKHIDSIHFPEYIESWICVYNFHIVIMEYIKGEALIDFYDRRMPKKWWRSIIKQLIVSIYQLEEHKITHNDFWDANVMIQPINPKIDLDYEDEEFYLPIENVGYLVRIIDFQYTNQYTKHSKIIAPYVVTKEEDIQKEKKRLGWSSKFLPGGDLNQILGILSEYKYIPEELKRSIQDIIYKRKAKNIQFPYAIQKANILTSGRYLMKNFEEIFEF